MRVLIDECVPRKLKNLLAPHDCETVPDAGFAGKKNGELLMLAERAGFEAFLTIDHGIEFEQNISERRLTILLIRPKSSRLEDVVPYVPGIVQALKSIQMGQLIRIPR
jgi:hypothetical protein